MGAGALNVRVSIKITKITVWSLSRTSIFFSLTVTAKKLRHSASFPLAGDIQIGMEDKKGQLEVEVIRARSLTQKPGSKSTPGKERWYWVWTGESDISKKIKIFTAFEFYVLRFASSD